MNFEKETAATKHRKPSGKREKGDGFDCRA